jgi:membrane peptidoglycan carboxypeptidase
VANTLSNMLLNVVQDGTGQKAAIPGHDVMGKTGTINNDFSATFVGGTPDYTVSVMYFNPKAQEDVGGHGGGIPAQIFHDAMAPILANQPNTPFAPADPAVAAGTQGPGAAEPTTTATSDSQGNGGAAPTQPTPPVDQTPVLPPDTNGDGLPG